MKEGHVIVRNTGENHVEKYGEMDYRSWPCVINHEKEPNSSCKLLDY
jgi:hypothetical protein